MTLVHWVLIGLVAATMATASPTPSPTLDKVLAPAPSSDYIEADATSQTVMEGPFNAQEYAAKTNGSVAVQTTLERNGFIGGYGRTWVQRSTQHVLIEAVLAFDGARDAKKWLAAAQLSDKSDARYQNPIPAPGIPNYYGSHLVGSGLFTDTFGIVKGNDYFWIITISRQDDLGGAGATQAKAVYDFAPPYTIPPSRWPESIATPRETVAGFGPLIGNVLLIAFLVSLAILVYAVARRSARRSAVSPVDGVSAVQLSPDGNFWWDGRRWRDSSREAPAGARLSSDRKLWWDGRHWRPVPKVRV